MAEDAKAALAALITELQGVDPYSTHPAGPIDLATRAVGLAVSLHSDEAPIAHLLKARWLRIASFRGLCHPSVALPEIHQQLAAAESAMLADAVALERAWILMLENKTPVAAESVCALIARADLSAQVVAQAGMLAFTIVLERQELLSEELVTYVRNAFLDSHRGIESEIDALYFEASRYLMDAGLGLVIDHLPLQERLVAYCDTESDPTPQIYAVLVQTSEVLWRRGMWSPALDLQLAVASSRAPGEIRSTALAMAFRTSAQKSSLTDFKRVGVLASNERDAIQASMPEEGRGVDTLQILLAQAEAAVHLAGSIDAEERAEAEITASDSMWQLANARASVTWSSAADDFRGAFDEKANRLDAKHQQLLMGLAARSVAELTLSEPLRPAPPRHPRDFRDFQPAIDISTDLTTSASEDLPAVGQTSPRTSRSRQIGVLAENIFSSACAALGWVVSKTPQESDYGIDFRVEPVFDRQVPGIEFFAQIKGTAQDLGPMARVLSIRSATASYWRAKLVPVAVFLVDVNSSAIRYGWFDGALGSEPEGVTVRLDEQFPGNLTETLSSYYESLRTDAVSSAALDSMLEAAATLSHVLADDAVVGTYPHLAEAAARKHGDSKFTIGEIQRQIRLGLLSGTLARLRQPSLHMPELLDGPIADTRREIVALASSFMASMVTDRTRETGLKDNMPLTAGVIQPETYNHLRPYLSYLASRLTMQLATARSNLTRRHMYDLARSNAPQEDASMASRDTTAPAPVEPDTAA